MCILLILLILSFHKCKHYFQLLYSYFKFNIFISACACKRGHGRHPSLLLLRVPFKLGPPLPSLLATYAHIFRGEEDSILPVLIPWLHLLCVMCAGRVLPSTNTHRPPEFKFTYRSVFSCPHLGFSDKGVLKQVNWDIWLKSTPVRVVDVLKILLETSLMNFQFALGDSSRASRVYFLVVRIPVGRHTPTRALSKNVPTPLFKLFLIEVNYYFIGLITYKICRLIF